jgi:hypothetical protein
MPDARKMLFKLLFICNNDKKAGLFREVLEETGMLYELLTAKTGEEAENKLEYRSKHFIDLIFSVYHEQDTLRLLDHLKDDPYLRRIPVILIIGTEHPSGLCYTHYTNCCIADSDEPEIFKKQVQEALHYWTNVVALPEG